MYFSDRSSVSGTYPGKRWLIDHGSWYKEAGKKDGNENTGMVYALSTAIRPWFGSGWTWKTHHGADPQFEIFTFS